MTVTKTTTTVTKTGAVTTKVATVDFLTFGIIDREAMAIMAAAPFYRDAWVAADSSVVMVEDCGSVFTVTTLG